MAIIDVNTLLEKPAIPSNYYSMDSYASGDFEAGTIATRSGDRLLALSDLCLQGIVDGIEEELGEASQQVLWSCGRWWGKNFFRRFAREMGEYHGKSLAELEMVNFLQSWKHCWKAHGWGKVELDSQYREQGLMVIRTWQSSFAQASVRRDRPSCSVEAGFFSAFFTQLSGESLHCVQTTCESMGSPCNTYLVGNELRLEVAEAAVRAGESHAEIVSRLFTTGEEE
ncbi:MAG: V4R domain-containing protein [Synechococcus sp.]